MRYYLVTITYNKVADAEDRPQPKGFNTIDEACKAFHLYLTQNIKGATVGWCLAIIFNEYGNVEYMERWQEETISA